MESQPIPLTQLLSGSAFKSTPAEKQERERRVIYLLGAWKNTAGAEH
jgi:hypothetical protein